MIRRLVFGCVLVATCLVCRTVPAAASPGAHALQLLAQRYGVTPGEIAGFLATLPAPQIALLQQDLAELQALTPAQVQLLLNGAAGAQDQAGGSGQTVARWVQMAPGSSVDAILSGSWGDRPTSIFPTILARAVISGGACPVVRLDRGLVVPMRVRFTGAQLTNVPGHAGSTNGAAGYPQYFVQNTAPENFASGVPMATTSWAECETVLPYGFKTATVDGVDLKLPVLFPRTILVTADTGCRMAGAPAANGGNQQDCSSPTAFPWAFLASWEATFKPDLIVHVGDWFYRDTNCDNTFPGCLDTTSPNYETWGDTFDSWNADVLFPAGPLLAAAPWVMTRGNHESCGRGARGWYALLDPYPYNYASVSCAPSSPATPANGVANHTPDFEPSYVVPAGGVNFLVHDSSLANDSAVATALAQNYDLDLTNLLHAVGPDSINVFTTHKPSFGLTYGAQGTPSVPDDTAGDYTEQAVVAGGTYAASAFAQGVPANIGLFLSGHIHQFEYVNFADTVHYAPQMIVGQGGTLLDPDLNTGLVPANGTQDPAAYAQTDAPFAVNQITGGVVTALAARTYGHDEFGFALLTVQRAAGGAVTGFDAAVYKASSTLAGHCAIALRPSRNITCDF